MEQQRQPYVERFVKDVANTDFKVSLCGIIVERGEHFFLMDDGTGRMLVTCSEMPKTDAVRVLGRVMGVGNEVELQAEIFQDLSGVDLLMLKQVRGALLERMMKKENIL